METINHFQGCLFQPSKQIRPTERVHHRRVSCLIASIFFIAAPFTCNAGHSINQLPSLSLEFFNRVSPSTLVPASNLLMVERTFRQYVEADSVTSQQASPKVSAGGLAVQVNAAGRLGELIDNYEPEIFSETQIAHDDAVQPDSDVELVYTRGTIERAGAKDTQTMTADFLTLLQLGQIFGWDLDFANDLDVGDHFTVIREAKYFRGTKIANGDIVAAEVVNRGQVHRAIGFRDMRGKVSYYTPDGKSLGRKFLHTPILFGRISSPFNHARYHPILHIWLAHPGVDYTAPAGTPVQATAGGRVVAVGRKGGYGNVVIVEHDSRYRTLYAHLLDHRPDLRTGARVDQGEVIGHVGRTGRATGPHLHYELRINGKALDPLHFEAPADDPIPLIMRRAFLHAAIAANASLDTVRDAATTIVVAQPSGAAGNSTAN